MTLVWAAGRDHVNILCMQKWSSPPLAAAPESWSRPLLTQAFARAARHSSRQHNSVYPGGVGCAGPEGMSAGELALPLTCAVWELAPQMWEWMSELVFSCTPEESRSAAPAGMPMGGISYGRANVTQLPPRPRSTPIPNPPKIFWRSWRHQPFWTKAKGSLWHRATAGSLRGVQLPLQYW